MLIEDLQEILKVIIENIAHTFLRALKIVLSILGGKLISKL